MDAPRIKPAIAPLTEAEEREAYPHPGRRLSKYEPVSRARDKPLPHIPPPAASATTLPPPPPLAPPQSSSREFGRKPNLRIPSHRRWHSYSQLQTASASSSGTIYEKSSSPLVSQTVAAPRQSTSLQTLKRSTSSTSTRMQTLNRAMSLSESPLPPGASGHRSSRKINQLIGYDLDIPVDAAAAATEYRDSNPHTNAGAAGSGSESDDDDYFDDYYGGDGDGDHDYDGQSPFNMEEGLLPLLEEDEDAAISSRESSWVPRTPGSSIIPAPLHIRHHGRSPSAGSISIANPELSPVHGDTGGGMANFSLSEGLPMRWEPTYGQFTDKKAANDYHRFTTELAASPQRHSLTRAESPEQTTTTTTALSRKQSSRSAARVRLSATSAIYRLWDSPLAHLDSKMTRTSTPPPPPPPPPPLPVSTTLSSSLPLAPPPRPPSAPPFLSSGSESTAAGTPPRRNTLRKPRRPDATLSVVEVLQQKQQHQQQQQAVQSSSSSSQQQLLQPTPQCSAFDYDSDDDEDERGRGLGRKWWRRSSDEEEHHRSSSEWPSVTWPKRQQDDDAKHKEKEKEKEKDGGSKEKPSFGGGVRGLLANARDRALTSPAERRRSDLRKSIKVIHAPGENQRQF